MNPRLLSQQLNNPVVDTAGKKYNELPLLRILECQLYYRGGNSPVSTYPLYQYRVASKACERLAKRLFSTCLSTHLRSSGSTVTPTFGLFTSLISTKVPPEGINIHDRILSLVPLSGIRVDKNERSTSYSGSTEERTLHQGRGTEIALNLLHSAGPPRDNGRLAEISQNGDYEHHLGRDLRQRPGCRQATQEMIA